MPDTANLKDVAAKGGNAGRQAGGYFLTIRRVMAKNSG